jgi:hypothetical protein
MPIRIRIALAVFAAPMIMAQSCDEGGICERAAAFELHFCVQRVAEATRDCYLGTGAPCDAAQLDPYFAFLRTRVETSCTGSRPQPAGYGSQMHGPALADRLVEECRGQIASLVARSFGGPQASVLNEAISTSNAADQACMDAAFTEGAALLATTFNEHRLCAQSPDLLDAPCDLAATQANVVAAQTAAVLQISASCASSSLEDLTGLDEQKFVARARAQADCMTSAGIGETFPLPDSTCGPNILGPSIAVPNRATPTQIVLDASVWGTRCGDGSPYAFWIGLAPSGSPLENVVIFMQGGGVCLFNDDCAARFAGSPGLFNATGDGFPNDGIFDANPAANPFAEWTKVFLPYCTQDVFAGMGTTETFPNVTVHRYGARNVRAALQYVRNLIWTEKYDSDIEGYRPDKMTVLFSGNSAGGFGTLYNLHYPIDDLRWAHTTSVAGAALALDNGLGNGVIGLGFAKFPLWNVSETIPPYCLEPACGAGPIISAAHAQRLRAVPDQQLLQVSNQIDNTQRDTTAFPSTVAWTSAARASYCTEAGRNGVFYFLDAVPQSVHGGILTGPEFSTLEIAGVALEDWLGGAFTDPTSLADRVEEGTLVTAFPGVEGFTCPVDP